MAYLLYKRVTPKLPAWTFVLWIALLVTIGHWHGNYREEWIFCLMLALTLPFFRELSWKPLLRSCHLIARYSYGIYLCHGIAIAVGVYELRGQNFAVRIFAYFATPHRSVGRLLPLARKAHDPLGLPPRKEDRNAAHRRA